LVIDESFKSKNEKARFTTAIRQELGGFGTADVAIGSIRYRDSRRESLLQVADMLVGAVARSYEMGDSRFRQLIPTHQPQRAGTPVVMKDLWRKHAAR